jgi:hypothetical protein
LADDAMQRIEQMLERAAADAELAVIQFAAGSADEDAAIRRGGRAAPLARR